MASQVTSRLFSRKRPITKCIIGLVIADTAELLPGQTSADLRAIAKGFTNALVAVPILGACVYDYSTSLKHLTFPSEEYIEARRLCHERSATKVLKLA